MDEFIKLLDKDLEHKSHEIIDDTIYQRYVGKNRGSVPILRSHVVTGP
ncbi:MAG TPA: hypothetical protein VFD57_02840 [Clostridia bacterium]|nr:hypothetical protein [Clostridia bacterium]